MLAMWWINPPERNFNVGVFCQTSMASSKLLGFAWNLSSIAPYAAVLSNSTA